MMNRKKTTSVNLKFELSEICALKRSAKVIPCELLPIITLFKLCVLGDR